MAIAKARYFGFVLALAALWAGKVLADEAIVVLDFERRADVGSVRSRRGIERSDEVSSRGRHSLKVDNRDYLNIRTPRLGRGREDDLLRIDLFNAAPRPVRVRAELFDAESRQGFWYRHVREYTLRPGWTTLSFRVSRLHRGTKGSQRIRDSFLDPESISRIDLAFLDADAPGFVYIDNIRFEPDRRMPEVEGLRAFDFGPENQAQRYEFTRSSRERYDPDRGFGWSSSGWPGAVRDYIHPNDVLGDFREARGETFSVDLPNGAYQVRVFYEDHGWWMSQFVDFEWRTIKANGKLVYEERLDERQAAERFYRFADVEPCPDTDVYRTYIQEGRYKPKAFEVAVTGGRLDLAFDADRPMVCRIAAIVLWPTEFDEAGREWMSTLHDRMRAEFEAENVYVDTAERRSARDLPEPARQAGFVVFSKGRTDPTGPTYVPEEAEVLDAVRLVVCPGEQTGRGVSVHIIEGGGTLDLHAELDGPAVSVHRIQNRLRRHGGGYTIVPDIIRADVAADLDAGRTRQFWLEVQAPDEAEPAEYRGTLTVRVGDRERTLPLVVEVLPFRLAEPDFIHGFFGLMPDPHGPDDALEQVIQLLGTHGMTAVGGAPLAHVALDDGELTVDFSVADRVVSLARAAGLDRELHTYGGGGIRGDVGAAARALDRPYWELMKEIGDTVRAHAEANDWPPVSYASVDEPHWSDEAVGEAADRVRNLNEALPWVITTGFWSPRPENRVHRRLLDELDRTMMGRISRDTVAYLTEQGKGIGYYGGHSRHRFGYRMWAARSEGFTAYYGWHLYIRYGDLYYDLDGREPVVSMVYYTPTEVRPALRLKAARAGVNDFRYLQTLAEALDRAEPGPAADAARRVLEKAVREADLYGSDRVDRPDDLRHEVIEAIRTLTQNGPA